MPVQVQKPKSVNAKKQKIKCSSNWRPYFFSIGTTVHTKHTSIQHTIVTKLPDVGSAIHLQRQPILKRAGTTTPTHVNEIYTIRMNQKYQPHIRALSTSRHTNYVNTIYSYH